MKAVLWFIIFLTLTWFFGTVELFGATHMVFSFLLVITTIWIVLDGIQWVFERFFSGLLEDDDKK